MSHIVQIETEVRDPLAVATACQRIGLPEPMIGTAQLYSGTVEGLLVQLPGWLYPAIVHLETGRVEFDNFGGAWGAPEQLNRFLQAYAVEKAKREARRKGYAVTEHALADGSVRLTVQVGGGA